jgi:hypothetical protein
MKTRILICLTLFCLALGVGSAEAAAYLWTGTSSANWNSNLNWTIAGGVTPATAPGSGDDVTIPVSTGPTINAAGLTCLSLTITGTTTIKLTNALTVTTFLTVTSPTAVLTLSGTKTLTVTGDLTVNNNTSITISSSAATPVVTVGSITIATSGVTLTLAGKTMAVTGAITVNNNATFAITTTLTAGSLTINNSGTTLAVSVGAAVTITNALTISSTASSAALTLTGASTFEVKGDLTVDNSATITPGSTGANFGSLSLNSPGITLTVAGTKALTVSSGAGGTGIVTINDSGTIALNNTLAGAMASTGLKINASLTVSSTNATTTTFAVSGTTTGIVANSTATIAAGTNATVTASLLTINNSGTNLTLTGTAASYPLLVTNNVTLTLSTMLTSSTATVNTGATLTFDGSSGFQNSSGGTLLVNNGGTLQFAPTWTGTFTTTNTNIGTSPATTPLADFEIGANNVSVANITNYGKINCAGCNLNNSVSSLPGIQNYGTINVSTGSTFTTNRTITNESTGTFTVSSSTFNTSATGVIINNSGSFTMDSTPCSLAASTSITNAATGFFYAESTSNPLTPTIITLNNHCGINNLGTFDAGIPGSSCSIDIASGANQAIITNNAGAFFNVGSTSIITSEATATGPNIAKITNTSPGVFTLQSDANGSAAIGPWDPSTTTTTFTGTFTVQRYCSAVRQYRLLSSPVYASTDGNGIKDYEINYLKTNIYLTGTDINGGFDNTVATANPTLYLYEENFVPQYSTFLNSNFVGIDKINNAVPTTYNLNTNLGPLTSTSIPVGTGYLCFFRGDRSVDVFGTETTPGYAPAAVALNATGTLVTGQVYARDWYSQTTPSAASPQLGATLLGYTLVGNPYASTIDLNTYQTGSATTGIYGYGIGNYLYELNPSNGQYGIYDLSTFTSLTNSALRYIPSGQGFFVVATTGAQLVFNESAKTSTLISPSSSILMARRINSAALNSAPANASPSLHLQMFKDTINNEDIVIAFNHNANTKYVFNEDAPHKAGSGVVSLASFSSDGVSLAVNKMPLPNQTPEVIPLHVGATSNGTYQLKMLSLQNLPALYDVWLMDAYKKDSLDIKHNPAYSFEITVGDTNTYGVDRFKVVVRQNPALMVHLLNFGASKTTGGANVVWSTENEVNYTHFAVERSSDGGATFNIIDTLLSSALGAYTYLDAHPPLAADMYRLKMVDLNGTVSYSNVITLMYANTGNTIAINNLMVYPNPATGTVNLAIDQTTAKSAYNIQIINNLGAVIKTAQSSSAQWQTDVSNLAPGTYFITVINTSNSTVVGKSAFVKL